MAFGGFSGRGRLGAIYLSAMALGRPWPADFTAGARRASGSASWLRSNSRAMPPESSGFQALSADNGTCYIIRRKRLEPHVGHGLSHAHSSTTVSRPGRGLFRQVGAAPSRAAAREAARTDGVRGRFAAEHHDVLRSPFSGESQLLGGFKSFRELLHS